MTPSPSPLPIPLPDGPLSRWLLDPAGTNRRIFEVVKEFFAGAVPFLVASLLLAFLTAIACRLVFRAQSERLARGGRLLRILPPPEIDADGAMTLWMGLHALLRPWWRRMLFGQPYLAWELLAEDGAASIGLWVSRGVPPGLVEQAVASAWPGAIVDAIDPALRLPKSPSASCELTLFEDDRFPLGEGVGEDPLRLALGALGLLDSDEIAAIQIVARPVTTSGRRRLRSTARDMRRGGSFSRHGRGLGRTPQRSPDPSLDLDVKHVLSKAAFPLWEVVLRISVSSKKRSAARGKIHALAGALGVFEGRNGFVRRRLRGGRLALASRRMRRGILLSSPELARLATLPSPRALPSLERARAKTVAPPRELPRVGKPLGTSDRPGYVRPVALKVEDASHHVHLIGETGTGKSTLIARMVLADAEAGRAAVVIDPKGDLVTSIIERLPESAIEKTCLMDPDDTKFTVGLNMLAGDDPHLMVDQVVSVFKRIFEDAWGARSDDIMRSVCLTLARVPGATLGDVGELLTNDEWRAQVLADPGIFKGLGDVSQFWDWYESLGHQQAANTGPLMNKLRAFLLRGPVLRVVGQANPKLDIGELIESGGLLLVRIPKGTIGEETSRLLGAFVVTRVWQTCMRRARVGDSVRKPVGLYVDEMHNYLALPRSFEDMLAEARGYGLSMVLAHQHMGQLPKPIKEALAANARTKIVFACSPEDATALSRHFDPYLSDHDLANLSAFQAACRPCLDGAHGPGFTFRTEALPPPIEQRAGKVRAASAARFGVDSEQLEVALRSRQSEVESGVGSGVESGVGSRFDRPQRSRTAGGRR